jgi:hypothetical protein
MALSSAHAGAPFSSASGMPIISPAIAFLLFHFFGVKRLVLKSLAPLQPPSAFPYSPRNIPCLLGVMIHRLVDVLGGRDFGFTGDACLAKTASIAVKMIMGFYIFIDHGKHVPSTFYFVMTQLRYGAGRASWNALFANAFGKK